MAATDSFRRMQKTSHFLLRSDEMRNFKSVLCACLAVLFLTPALFAQETICINGKCYPVVSKTVVQSTQSEVTVQVAAIPQLKSDTVKFRKALLESAKKARQDGEISFGQYFSIVVASRNPAKLEAIKNAVHETAIEEGMATATAIDWDKLGDFLVKIVPLIIQIIGAFA